MSMRDCILAMMNLQPNAQEVMGDSTLELLYGTLTLA